MEISDLIKIGKLVVRSKGGTRIVVCLKTEYLKFLPRLKEVFLIFKDHRVRYGTIDIIKVLTDNKAVVKIADPDLSDELSSEESVNLCLDEEEIYELDEENTYFDPVGMKVIWNEQEVAHIKDFFYNGAHDVYELEMTDGRLVLIPDVEAFVIETNIEQRFIRVVNLDQFLEL
jgi:ribosomal 30S subunit maturation factor RimM